MKVVFFLFLFIAIAFGLEGKNTDVNSVLDQIEGLKSQIMSMHARSPLKSKEERFADAQVAVATSSQSRAEAHARARAMIKAKADQVLRDIARVRRDLSSQEALATSSSSRAHTMTALKVRANAVHNDMNRLKRQMAKEEDAARATDRSSENSYLSVSSGTELTAAARAHARARAQLRAKASSVIRDIERIKRDLSEEHVALSTVTGRDEERESKGKRVQTTVDLVHCRNLAMAAMDGGTKSEEFKEYLAKVFRAQSTQKPMFQALKKLEDLLALITFSKKQEGARLIEQATNEIFCEGLGHFTEADL